MDASKQCKGASLTQPWPEKVGPGPGIPEEIPVYFLSHKLSPTEQRWPVIEKEEYAIIYALQKLDYYSSGATFILNTDPKPLQYLLKAEWKNKKKYSNGRWESANTIVRSIIYRARKIVALTYYHVFLTNEN